MYRHIFIHRIKCLVRDKQMVFWTFLFPLVLSTLFYLALSNVYSGEQFKAINIAVVDNAEYQKEATFQSALDSVTEGKNSSENKGLFNVTVTTQEEADQLLENNKIIGYIFFDQGAHLMVKDSGLNQTIIKSFLDNYLQMRSTATMILTEQPQAAAALSVDMANQQSYLQEVPAGKAEPNTILNFYYALIAMACMYGSFWGLKEVSAVQADISPQGARVNMAPAHKLKVFGSAICAATAVQFVSLLILLLYLSLVIKVDFGSQLGYIVLTCFAGCLMGVSFGALVAAVVKKSEGIKVAVLISVSMLLSFLSGLMSSDVKYMVNKAFPLVAYINPANLVTDAFYSLYYYSTYHRFFINIALLFGFAALFYLIVYFVMRRQKYASL